MRADCRPATDAIEQFRSAIYAAGIEPPDHLVGDGKIHRFRTNGRADDDSGWYTLTAFRLARSAAGAPIFPRPGAGILGASIQRPKKPNTRSACA